MLSGNLASAPEAGLKPGQQRDHDLGTVFVCHVISGDLWAGAEAQAAALLRYLSRDKGFRLFAIVLNEGRLAEELRACCAGVAVIPESTNGFLRVLEKASRYIRPLDIRILHSHRYKENLLAALLAWRCRVPVVVRTAHGRPEPFRGLASWKQRVLQTTDQLVARFATDHVISVTSELRSQIERYVAPGRVSVIRNGFDELSVRSALAVEEAKNRLGISEESFVLGYAGRLEPIKRLDLFLSIAADVATRVPRAQFVIAGEGSEALRLRRAAGSAGLGDRVSFLGNRDDIYDVLRAFDVFLLCSDHEGLPIVLLEALCLGVPVVARRVGGIPEVLGDNVGGLLVESDSREALAEACVRLLENPGLRKQLAQAGRLRVVQNFSGERTAYEVSNLYRSLCPTQ